MRAPQRKFVVEFKSRSRKSKVNTPASIWGDTDLKAVSRELEDQSEGGHFAPPTGASTFMDTEPAGSEIQAVIPALHHPSLPEAAVLSLPDFAKDTTAEVATETENKQSLPVEPTSGPAKRRGKARAAAKGKAPLTFRAKHHQPASGKNTETYITRGDLDDLIAENARLKAELREELTADNRRLQEMLLRFA